MATKKNDSDNILALVSGLVSGLALALGLLLDDNPKLQALFIIFFTLGVFILVVFIGGYNGYQKAQINTLQANSITTTNTILPANTTPLHNKTTTTTTTAPTTTSTSTTSTSTTTTTAPASTSTIPSNTVNASVEPNTIPAIDVTTYLLIPISVSSTGQYRFSYIPIETTNTIQILYLCKYIPYVYQNPLYQTDHIGQSFASIYTLKGQYQFANLGNTIASTNSTTPPWLTAYCN